MTSASLEPKPTLLNSTFENAKSQIEHKDNLKTSQEQKPTLLNSTFNNVKPSVDHETSPVQEEEKPTILGSTFTNVNQQQKEEKKPVDVDSILTKLDEQIYEKKEPTPMPKEDKPTILGSTFTNTKQPERKDEKEVDLDTLLNKVNKKLQEAEEKAEPKKESPVVKPSSIYEGKVEPSDIRIDYSSRDEDTLDTFKETTVPTKVETSKQDHELLDEINTVLNHKPEPKANTSDMMIEPKIFEDTIDDKKENVYNLDNTMNDLNHKKEKNTYSKETPVSKIDQTSTPEKETSNSSVMINNDIIIDKDSTEDDDNFFDDFFDDDDWS